MKTSLLISIASLALTFSVSSQAFQEKQLVRAMGQSNFSAALMTSAMDVARDLNDKTGCLYNTKMNPDRSKFVICEFKNFNKGSSRCHLIDIVKNKVETGPVAFGKKGLTHLADKANKQSKKTLLGTFLTNTGLDEKSNIYTRELVDISGEMNSENLRVSFAPKSSRIPASTKGEAMTSGKFAQILKDNSANVLWVNHHANQPYDNSCGHTISRVKYESDMNDVQVAEHRKAMREEKALADRRAKKLPKRGIASEKEEK